MNNHLQQSWWFENQYGKSVITINSDNITISHKGLTTFSLKKQRDNIIFYHNIKTVMIKAPTFWQAGYLYLVLVNEPELLNDQQILLANSCIAIKRNSELQDITQIKTIIDKLV